jgi:hypothetical protein
LAGGRAKERHLAERFSWRQRADDSLAEKNLKLSADDDEQIAAPVATHDDSGTGLNVEEAALVAECGKQPRGGLVSIDRP